MKNKFLVKSLSLSLMTVMLCFGTMPRAVRASDWSSDSGNLMEDSNSQDMLWDDSDDNSDGSDSGFDSDPIINPTLAPEPTLAPDTDSEDDGGLIEDPTVDPSDDGGLFEDPTPTPVPTEGGGEVDPFQEVTVTPQPGEDIEPTQGPQESTDFTSDDNLTPTPSGAVTATPTPSVTPLVTGAVKITTNMISNLHAGNQFYLDSLKNNYGLTFSNDFSRIMDDIEYEYLFANQLIRADGTRGVTTDALGNPLVSSNVAPIVGQASGVVTLDLGAPVSTGSYTNTGNSGNSPVVLDFVGDVAFDTTDVSVSSVSSLDPSVAGTAEDFTSGPENVFTDMTPPEGLRARNWQDVLAIYCYNKSKTGAVQFELDKNAKKELAEIFRELNPLKIENGQAYYGNKHVQDYIIDHNIPKWDRAVLKKYTETDCKLLCATVTGAKGFVRQSVGDNVSEERVNVIAAAYSLVGKVGYFWGGKSTYIGMDPSWGIVQTVTSEGSGTTGTLRGYGLDCSGFVTWAVINGYKNVGMKSLVGDGTSDQWLKAKVVTEAGAQPGDLVFMAGPEAGADNHVGILVGKTDMGDWIAVHCSSGQNGVTVGEAYSASFRYIREPSFFPVKSATPNVPLPSVDDIIVDADLGVATTQVGSSLFGSDVTYSATNEDFMDIILLSPSQETVSPWVNTPAIETGGLVVLDETGRGDNLTPYVTSLFGDGSSFSLTNDVVVLDSLGIGAEAAAESVNTFVNSAASVVVLDYEGERAPVCGPNVTTAPVSILFEDGTDYQTSGQGIVVIENLNISEDGSSSIPAVIQTSSSPEVTIEESELPSNMELVPIGEEDIPEADISSLEDEAISSVVTDILSESGSPESFLEQTTSLTTDTAIFGSDIVSEPEAVVLGQEQAAPLTTVSSGNTAQIFPMSAQVVGSAPLVSTSQAQVVEILPTEEKVQKPSDTVVVLDLTGFELPVGHTNTSGIQNTFLSMTEKKDASILDLVDTSHEKSDSLFDLVWEKLFEEGKVTKTNPRKISLKPTVNIKGSLIETMLETKSVLKQAQESTQPIVILYE